MPQVPVPPETRGLNPRVLSSFADAVLRAHGCDCGLPAHVVGSGRVISFGHSPFCGLDSDVLALASQAAETSQDPAGEPVDLLAPIPAKERAARRWKAQPHGDAS